jgi:dolichol-phosphate mannosyltransferase
MNIVKSNKWSKDQQVELILPAHNESKTIESVVREFYEICVKQNEIDLRFIITEDGSTDNTAETIRQLASELPITLIHTDYRKGYSRAVVDGLRGSHAPFVVACDSDGQYDPNDLLRLLESTGEADYVVGYRNPRADVLIRKIMSTMFKMAYSLFQGGRYKDPSCPFVVFSKKALQTMVLDNPRVPFMPQGLWWEMSARAKALNIQTLEVPVSHRRRDDGGSVVYKPRRIPRIVADNLFGLWLVKGDVEYQNRQRVQAKSDSIKFLE